MLLLDSEPEANVSPPRRGLPLTGSERNAILHLPTGIAAFAAPEFLAVGIRLGAFLSGSVKGGGDSQKLPYFFDLVRHKCYKKG